MKPNSQNSLLTVPAGNGCTVNAKQTEDVMKTVSEVCREAGVTRKTLYYYDKISLLKPVKRSGKQRAKLYSDSAVDTLKTIKQYQEAGLRLSEVNLILDHPDQTVQILLKVQKRLLEQEQTLSAQIDLLSRLIEKEESEK